MRGLSCWIITDGKAGNDVQAKGVADALGLDYEIRHVTPTGVQKLLAPRGGPARHERFGQTGSRFGPPWPDVAIAVGRASIPYIRAIGRAAGPATYRIVLLDPHIGAGCADVIWVPEHDRRRGPNVITTLTAPHSFTTEKISRIRSVMPPEIKVLSSPRIALLLGGRTRAYRYGDDDHKRFVRSLRALSRIDGSLMITPSRRTHGELWRSVLEATSEAERLVYDGDGPNPYGAFLCHADAIVVTADSINMCGEAVATGRPVYVFEPAGSSRKFRRFHEALRHHGATRVLPDQLDKLESWTYKPLHSAQDIARQIEQRWVRRQSELSQKQA